MKTTSVCGLAPPAAAATSMPVRPGMRISRKATSGRCEAMASSAAPPSSATSTTSSSGQAMASSRCKAAASSFSSSATMHLGMIAHSRHRQRDRRGDTIGEIVADEKRRRAAVHEAQALAQVLQADARTGAVAAETHAVIGHGERKAGSIDAGADPDAATAGLRLEAVLDGVLDQG